MLFTGALLLTPPSQADDCRLIVQDGSHNDVTFDPSILTGLPLSNELSTAPPFSATTRGPFNYSRDIVRGVNL